MLMEVRKDLRNPKIHAYNPMYVWSFCLEEANIFLAKFVMAVSQRPRRPSRQQRSRVISVSHECFSSRGLLLYQTRWHYCSLLLPAALCLMIYYASAHIYVNNISHIVWTIGGCISYFYFNHIPSSLFYVEIILRINGKICGQSGKAMGLPYTFLLQRPRMREREREGRTK